LTASHNRRHLVRAVLEGVAFSLKDCYAIIQEQGLELEQLRATGGGAKSLLWRQILADVLGVELVTTTAQEGPAFGAALLAGVACGIYESISQACDMTVRVVDRTEPRPELEHIYASAYKKYRALYPALKPIFSS
jgi:xylulokinase